MRNTDLAAALLSAMISHRPLDVSQAGHALDKLVRQTRSDGELARQWAEAAGPAAALPALLQVSNLLAERSADDCMWRAELETWLRNHPVLATKATHNTLGGSTTLHGSMLQVGSVAGDVHLYHGPGTPSGTHVVPRQLRPIPVHFANRTAELHELHDFVNARREQQAPDVAVISGPGGVGKTALALKWLHDVADRYPDGQLYADLWEGDGEPVSASSVLGGFLRALGLDEKRVPVHVHEAAGLFRSMTSGKRLAILMDNAVSAAQVRTLLPASADSAVVVTTRWRLGGLATDGAEFVPLAPLLKQDGVSLLTSTVGERRAAAEKNAVAGLAELCAGLPLALSIAAARLVTRPEWPIARVVRELADEQRRLRALTVEEVSVLSVFDVSYDALPPEAARAYRLTGFHPGPDFSARTAAAMLESSEVDATALLETLVDASVMESPGTERYRFHDLVRLHARQRAEAEDGNRARKIVVERLLKHFLALAVAVEQTVTPLEWRLGETVWLQPPSRIPEFTSEMKALDAIEAELPSIMAVLRTGHEYRLDALVWQLAEAMWSLFLRRKHFPDWITAYRLGIDSAIRCGDSAARSRMHQHLGFAYHNLQRKHEALTQGQSALAAAREAGHERATAEALSLLGMAYRTLGRFEDAIDLHQQAVAIDHDAGRAREEALGRRRLGQTYAAAGRIDEAVDQLSLSRSISYTLPDHTATAMTTVWLADSLTRTGRPDEAVDLVRDAWSTLAASGSSQYLAQAAMVWGEAAEALQCPTTALHLLSQARALYLEAGAPDLRRVDEGLDKVASKLPNSVSPPAT